MLVIFLDFKNKQVKACRKFFGFFSKNAFFRNRVDICEIESASLLSPLDKIEIGHDDSGVAPGWYLDKVIVTCNTTGCEQVTICVVRSSKSNLSLYSL